MRILLVEDEPRIADVIQRGLREKLYVVDIAYDGEEALSQAEGGLYDLVILDIMLPGKDGIFVCRELRSRKINVPVLMLTARDGLKDKVLGLNSGADDYLTKPFAFEELLARVRALLRRKSEEKTTTLKVADLELDQLSRKVSRAGKEINLTGKEFALLKYLMINSNQVITRTMIFERIWDGYNDNSTKTIDVYISYLRSKIDKGFDKRLIHTVRGAGYMLAGD